MKRVLGIGFFLCALYPGFLLLHPSISFSSELQKEQIQTHLRQGIAEGFNLNEKAALAELTKAVELDRENPIGYAYMAMAHLFFYEISFAEKEKKNKESLLLQTAEEAQIRGEKRLEKNSQDAEAFLAVAIAKMVKNRWEIMQENYFKALREIQNVWDYLEKARVLAPQNYDVYYPLGLLHYHLAQLTGVARWITFLFVGPGDREKGIRELELASEKGDFLKDLALANLTSVYAGYEKKPAQALPLAKRLKEKYPDNYNFSFALANIFSDLDRFGEAMSVAREIEKRIKSGIPPYRPELWSRHQQLLGKIFFDQGEYGKAIEYFHLALKDVSPYNARVRAWALVRLGMIQDVRKKRELAEEYYQKALRLESAKGLAQRAAREYLNKPYSPPKAEEK